MFAYHDFLDEGWCFLKTKPAYKLLTQITVLEVTIYAKI